MLDMVEIDPAAELTMFWIAFAAMVVAGPLVLLGPSPPFGASRNPNFHLEQLGSSGSNSSGFYS